MRPPIRVLVVDDDIPVRLLLARLLKTWGYHVWHVGSAVEAVGVMGTEPADIVMSDVSMPDHDGLWLVDQIRSRWPQTPIIMTTGAQDPEVVQKSRRLGAVAYVTKPFVPYRLREALEAAVLQCRRGLQPHGGAAQLAR
jgi:CheY-like chemotaxis protein